MDQVRDYSDQVAETWDDMRSSYFGEAVCETAMAKAYLRPEMVVADVGCGTGFMTETLAPQVAWVHAVDSSPQMLSAAQRKLAHYENVEYHLADGHALPLREATIDALFTNMFLQHAPDPAEAIAEMAALLRPGGRLIITDLDAHQQKRLGFERDEVRRWCREAGLVNVFVTSTDQSCCNTSEEGHEAPASIFLAVGARGRAGVKDEVRDHYSGRAEERSGCCSAEPSCECTVPDYSAEEWAQLPTEATGMALGCGNPVAIASLRPGEVVLDIGSGGGIDVFYAARQVYPGGKAIGVDMTPAMLARARSTAEKMGFTNVEFRRGEAGALPTEDESVDVILSNCVINLSPDKGQVFKEAFRALRGGGRLSVSDIVTNTALPEEVRSNPDQWASCIGGALPEGEYLDLIREAGFEALLPSQGGVFHNQDGLRVYSLYVTAYKPPVPSGGVSSGPQPNSGDDCG